MQMSFFNGATSKTIADMSAPSNISALPLVKPLFGDTKFVDAVKVVLDDENTDTLDRQIALVKKARDTQPALTHYPSAQVYKAMQTMCNRIAVKIAEENGNTEAAKLSNGRIKERKLIAKQA